MRAGLRSSACAGVTGHECGQGLCLRACVRLVRIGAKRVRYAAEAVASAVGKEAKRFARAVEGFQEVLGDHQDAVVAGRILEAGRLPFELMVSHQLPLERVGDAIQALNSNYQVDGRTALKIAIAPNGPVA